ncbi:transcriptional regulator with XRE-family HTH domain [Scopulibacillus daqui]|uniref:Transcriptional regulator with XRE-family HTH domain n=1 Tax=Scopulibacillus daqui TaxID=1469162 RepID=A0ABS2Q483_9BACL|nr:transcriptional regulator with XRE-family HTH domain [Scopulibacillus daqui]
MLSILSERLKQLRKEKKKTQQDIADYLGITRPAYTAYERGYRQPDYKTLEKLADCYDVSTDYLLGRIDNPKGIQIQPGRGKDNLFFWNLEDLDEEDIQHVKETIEFLRKRARKKKEDNNK